jgi:hypothetical protein
MAICIGLQIGQYISNISGKIVLHVFRSRIGHPPDPKAGQTDSHKSVADMLLLAGPCRNRIANVETRGPSIQAGSI